MTWQLALVFFVLGFVVGAGVMVLIHDRRRRT